MSWTREQRYRSYSSWSNNEIKNLKVQAETSPYKPKYHISPLSGLLNDPNGFSYFNGKWHVFYQSFPFGPVHGLKSWVHCVSDDLVHWSNLGNALIPSTKYDSHGVYSGSALAIKNNLFLAYTGNVRDKSWQRTSFQNGALMNQQGQITKLEQPLIRQPQHVTEHFRDPQLLWDSENYYILLGAQDKKTLKGEFSWFKSTDLKSWEDMGYLKHPFEDLGYMVECPNLVFVDGHPILIFCPQGLPQKELKYKNIYPNVYSVGTSFDFSSGTFIGEPGSLSNLDDGFDVYASQAFTAPNGKTYLISWIGLPEIKYPTDQENWAHCLSLVKELHFKDGHLLQTPLSAQKKLSIKQSELITSPSIAGIQEINESSDQQYELELSIDADQEGNLLLASSKDHKQGIQIFFNTGQNGNLTVDRSKAGIQFASSYGTKRSIKLPHQQNLELNIFIDHSVCEIFVNKGENVLTLRYFAPQENTKIAFISNNGIKYSGRYTKLTDM